MNKQIVAKVKFTKDGKIYNFLIKDKVKIAKLEKGTTVIVDTKVSSKKDTRKRRKAVLQDIKMMDIDRMKIKPTAYIVGISKHPLKLHTNEEKKAFWKEQKLKKKQKKNKNK